jgi:hypothetical protein
MQSGRNEERHTNELEKLREFLATQVRKKLCAGYAQHSVFLTRQGQVYTRGLNDHGQLGLGDNLSRYRVSGHVMPVVVPDLENIIDIEIGTSSTYCINQKHQVYVFGENAHGSLGVGDNLDRARPTLVDALLETKIVSVTSDCGITHFLDTKGNVYACGYFTSSAATGLGECSPINSPTKIDGLPPVKEVIHIDNNTFFLTISGDVYACGSNFDGILGIGNKQRCYQPVKLALPPIKQIDGCEHNLFFLTRDGRVFAIGSNINHQISTGITPHSGKPARYYDHYVELNCFNEPITRMFIGSPRYNLFFSRSESVYVHFIHAFYDNTSIKQVDEYVDFPQTLLPVPDEVARTVSLGAYNQQSFYKFGFGSETSLLCHQQFAIVPSLKLLSSMSFMRRRMNADAIGYLAQVVTNRTAGF